MPYEKTIARVRLALTDTFAEVDRQVGVEAVQGAGQVLAQGVQVFRPVGPGRQRHRHVLLGLGPGKDVLLEEVEEVRPRPGADGVGGAVSLVGVSVHDQGGPESPFFLEGEQGQGDVGEGAKAAAPAAAGVVVAATQVDAGKRVTVRGGR
jgi:hypothetical protein